MILTVFILFSKYQNKTRRIILHLEHFIRDVEGNKEILLYVVSISHLILCQYFSVVDDSSEYSIENSSEYCPTPPYPRPGRSQRDKKYKDQNDQNEIPDIECSDQTVGSWDRGHYLKVTYSLNAHCRVKLMCMLYTCSHAQIWPQGGSLAMQTFSRCQICIFCPGPPSQRWRTYLVRNTLVGSTNSLNYKNVRGKINFISCNLWHLTPSGLTLSSF